MKRMDLGGSYCPSELLLLVIVERQSASILIGLLEVISPARMTQRKFFWKAPNRSWKRPGFTGSKTKIVTVKVTISVVLTALLIEVDRFGQLWRIVVLKVRIIAGKEL